jgi:outer membrane protein assembly factor BamB
VPLLALGAAVLPAAGPLPADDWPGFRGADRTGVSAEAGLLPEWPPGGPKLLWKATGLGAGFSTPSVAGGRLYLLGARGKTELLIALDARGGKRLWETPVGRVAGGKPGPRSTPTVAGGLLYVLSSDGKLVCAEAAGGRVRWRRDLKADFGGRCGRWAYAESPLVDGDRVVCTPGGPKATLVALDRGTGAEVWRAAVAPPGRGPGYATAAYASAVAADLAGTRQYVQFLAGGVVGVSARDGKFLWHYDRPANDTANCSTPLARDDSVFAASDYGAGAGRARVVRAGAGFRAEELYAVPALKNHHGGMVLVGDHVYGTGLASLLCVDFRTGQVVWQDRCVGKGSVSCAGGRLYVRGEDGEVALVEATPAGYRERGRFAQPDRSSQKAWPYPVVAGGRLYLRDWDAVLCFDIKARKRDPGPAPGSRRPPRASAPAAGRSPRDPFRMPAACNLHILNGPPP